jgi:hypothetical protein
MIRGMEDGVEIARKLAGAKPWWKISARDVHVWTHPSSDKCDFGSPIDGIIGRLFDVSKDQLEGGSGSWAAAVTLVEQVRLGLAGMGDPAIVPPGVEHLRIRGSATHTDLVLDIDMGDFILPFCIPAARVPEALEYAGTTAWHIVGHVRSVSQDKDWFSGWHANIRPALEELVSKVGHGAAPLWFRMEPREFDCEDADLYFSGFEACMIVLSPGLDWHPIGKVGLHSQDQIQKMAPRAPVLQRRRAAMAMKAKTLGALGRIDPVAMAMIEQHAQDPFDIVTFAKEVARRDPGRPIALYRGAHEECLYSKMASFAQASHSVTSREERVAGGFAAIG